MCERSFSSRRTRPFSAMTCICLRTVVYCVGLRRVMVSWTSRTVLGPRLHSTVRISSSASVGLGGLSGIHDDHTTIFIVRQGEKLGECREFEGDKAGFEMHTVRV